MMRARWLALAAVTLALLASLVLAQPPGPVPPAGAHAVSAGNATLFYHVGPSADVVDEDLGAGETASIWFRLASNGTRLVAFVNVTPSNATTLWIPNGSVVLDAAANGSASANVSFATTIADVGRVDQGYSFAGEVYEERNGTLVLLAPVTGSGSFVVDVGMLVPPTAPTSLPYAWIVGATLLVGAVVVGFSMRARSMRRRMNEAPRRSQVLREQEMESRLERAKAPEKVAEIKQEIRQAEQVREKRRELQILEAKRADALKTLDLLKKRHESGGLTRLQYDNMAAKKKADLTRIEAEIAQMEREDAGAAA